MATINGTASGDTLNGTADADLIRGFEGDDAMSGNGGNDTIQGAEGNDTLTGGEGDDTFRFFSNSGRDKVTDFSVTNDKFEIRADGIDDFGDLIINNNANGDAVIRYTSDGMLTTITLLGVSAGALSSDDFSFG